MNILLTNATDIFAGGEDYVLILARYLQQRGHTVHVSANPGHLLLEKCGRVGIPTFPVRFTGMSRVFSVGAELGRFCRRNGIQVIHSNANYDRTAAAIASALSPARHVAGVHSSHSIQYNLTHWIRNRAGTAHFVADADSVRDVLVKEDRIDPGRITVVPIGVEDDPQEFRLTARQQTRAALDIPDSTIVIGNVARLVPFKGHRVLLDAAAKVLRKRPDALFLIVGDGELQEELDRQAHALGVASSVRFLGFRDDLAMLYPAFDMYCHSSLELAAEAFPIAILRALASGLPVVATNVGGIRMMVEEGKSGYLPPPERPAELAAALLSVLESPERRAAMGAASFSLFQRQFHASAMAARVEAIYQRVLQ